MKTVIDGTEVSFQVFTEPECRFEVPVTLLGDNHGELAVINGRAARELAIKVEMPRELCMMGYIMKDGDNFIVKRIAPVEQSEVKGFTFILPIEWNGKDPTPRTVPNGKSFRLLSIDTQGKLRETVTAIVRQGDKLFLTVQETYRDQLYRAGDVVRCPSMDGTKRATLAYVRDLLQELPDFVQGLPDISEYKRVDRQAQAINLRDGEGVVLWYSKRKQLGAVLLKSRNGHPMTARAHFSQVLTIRCGLKYLKTGEKVLFRKVKPVEGGSSFKWELEEVQVTGMMPGLVDLSGVFKIEEGDLKIS